MDRLWQVAGFCLIHWKIVIPICTVLGMLFAILYHYIGEILEEKEGRKEEEIYPYTTREKIEDFIGTWVFATILYCLIAFFWIVVAILLLVWIVRVAFPFEFDSEVQRKTTA